VSDSVQTVPIRLGPRSYDIHIGSGNLDALDRFLRSLRKASRAVVITDSKVGPLYGQRVTERLTAAGLAHTLLTVPAGEPSKSPEEAVRLWREMLRAGADRQSVVVALGGGVVGDLAGFVAAGFARGIPLLQIPTTLLAQVDSSVGGKVGVNLPEAKNIVGAFWQPIGVLIDTDVLASVPDRHYRAGLAEVVKYGVILDADFFAYLETNVEALNRREPSVLARVIARCCRLKADVVEQDEREESGLRAVLNYGHTFGHALEAAAQYGTLLHGEAVSIGMLCASRLAERLGRIDAETTRRQHALLSALGLPVDVPELPSAELLGHMRHDKKAEHGRLRFILPTRIGQVELVEVDDEPAILAAMQAPAG
jgi:3-dehydroquinate synthase